MAMRKDGATGRTAVAGRRAWLAGSVAWAALCVPQLAQAAENDAPAGLSEIIVTAQKRSENLQTVPIAVTAITEDRLQTNRVTNVQDLSGLAPNTIVRPAAGGSGQPAISMRGISAVAAVPGADKEVAVNLDGVYLGAARGTLFELPDVTRVEVLRGPQGTLFGRNSTAGSLSIITRNPTGKFAVKQDFSTGNYGLFRSRTTVDLPQIGPFSAIISYVHNQRRGDIRNLGAGTVWDRTGPGTQIGVGVSPATLGDHNTDTVFAALRFSPSANFEMVYKFDYSRDNFTPEGVAAVAINAAGAGKTLNTIFQNQPVGGGPWGPTYLFPDGKRPDAVNNFWSLPGVMRISGHNLTTTIHAADNITIKNIASYRTTYLNAAVSQIGGLGGLIITPAAAAAAALQTPAVSLAANIGQRYMDTGTNVQNFSWQASDEFQINYTSDAVDLTAGAIYYRSHDVSGTPLGVRTTAASLALPANGDVPLGNTGVSYNDASSAAVYGQAELHVLPVLDVVAGARFTQDDKSGHFDSGGVFQSSVAGCPVTSNPNGICRTAGTYTGMTSAAFTYSDSRPTYAIGLNYKPNRTTLAYVKFSTAYVSGGSIGGVAFLPETARSWELGAKTELFDRRLRANLALFDVKYLNVQSSQSGRNVGRPDLSTVVITGFDMHAKGFELELTAAPAEGLTLSGSLGYTEQELSKVAPLMLASVAGNTPATTFLPSGVPKWTYSLSAQYETQPLMGDMTAMFRVDANGRGKVRMESNPKRPLEIPGYQIMEFQPAQMIINARVALRHIAVGPLEAELALWSRNLTNDRSIQYPLTTVVEAASSFQQARTFGVDLALKF